MYNCLFIFVSHFPSVTFNLFLGELYYLYCSTEIIKHFYLNYIFHNIQSQNSLRKIMLYVIIFLHCLIKFIFIFTSTAIANDLFFCLQAVKREIFGNVHPINSVWNTHSSVMGSQTVLITWMKKTAVSAYVNLSAQHSILNISYLSFEYKLESWKYILKAFSIFRPSDQNSTCKNMCQEDNQTCVKYMHSDIILALFIT